MTKRPAEHPEPQRVYNPSDIYIPLTEKDATQEKLVDLIFERNAPFLPIRVLHPGEHRKKSIGDILKVLGRLREKQAHILNESGVNHLAVQVLRSDVLLDAASITSKIAGDKNRKLPIYRKLAEEELKMSAEIWVCLGFLSDDMRSMPNNGEFQLLSDEIPDQILNGDVDLTSIPLGEIQTYVAKLRLNEWMKSANADIQECIAKAFQYLKELSAKDAPEGPQGQPFEMMADLGTQSFVNLIGMVLNKKLSLPRRFEAIRLLEWAIAFFSIKRNPIYQAQQRVRREVHDLFKMSVWDATEGEFGPMRISEEVHRCALEAEKQDKKGGVPNGSLELTGRRVKSSIKSVLGGKGDIVGTSNTVVFDSRDKTLESSALKLKLKAELVRRCEAVCGGETTMAEKAKAELVSRCVAVVSDATATEEAKTDAEKTLADLDIRVEVGVEKILADLRKRAEADAEKTLVDLRARRIARGLDNVTFGVKPVMLDTLDDQVGCAIVINLSKPLKDLNRREKSLIGSLFTSFALDLTGRLCLTNVKLPERHLFAANPTNGKTSKGFRVYKIHGDYPVEAEVFDGGKRVKRRIMVPVEVQFLPAESYLRAHMDGETGVNAYAGRKARDLAPIILPDHIDGQKVFPITTSAR